MACNGWLLAASTPVEIRGATGSESSREAFSSSTRYLDPSFRSEQIHQSHHIVGLARIDGDKSHLGS